MERGTSPGKGSKVFWVTGVGTDTPMHAPAVADRDPLLAGLRRLMRLADSAGEPEAILRALADQLFSLVGADEVHVHHLSPSAIPPSVSLPSGATDSGSSAASAAGDPVVVYMFGGEGRLSYLVPPHERPPGVVWVASTGQSVLATGARELAACVPRLAAAGGVGCALLLGLAVRGEVEAVVVIARRRAESFEEPATQRAAALVDQAAVALALLRARAEAGTDAVTGCMNHRAMRRRLSEEIDRAARTGGRLSCMLIDLDDFKLVNDRHGHPAGDALLRGVARSLMGEFRAFDRVARYGGDEFVVILPNAGLESAALAAERALQRLAEVASFDMSPGVSASIGVAQWRAPMQVVEFLQACDEALLRGKRDGKGRVARAA
jgi:diguanylate cyclase (GGDEF)-like protein